MSIANTYRFFVPPTAFDGDMVRLEDADLAHQMGKVLRLHPGDQVLLLDGEGWSYTVVLNDLGRSQVLGRVVERIVAGGEPPIDLTLYVALLRAERFEWVLQKGTELGVRSFVPVQFSRSLSADRADERKLQRWQRIIREAAEQSCRGRLPHLKAPLGFAAACQQATQAELGLILWEGTAPLLRTVLRAKQPANSSPTPAAPAERTNPPHTTIALLSGPEGGITPAELTSAREHGMIAVSLGPRILRAETAPIAAAAALFYELE